MLAVGLSRGWLKKLTGLLTGHFDLRKQLERIGTYAGEPLRRLCGLEN